MTILDLLEHDHAEGQHERQAVFPQAARLLGGATLENLFYEAERQKSRQLLTDSVIFPADWFGVE